MTVRWLADHVILLSVALAQLPVFRSIRALNSKQTMNLSPSYWINSGDGEVEFVLPPNLVISDPWSNDGENIQAFITCPSFFMPDSITLGSLGAIFISLRELA